MTNRYQNKESNRQFWKMESSDHSTYYNKWLYLNRIFMNHLHISETEPHFQAHPLRIPPLTVIWITVLFHVVVVVRIWCYNLWIFISKNSEAPKLVLFWVCSPMHTVEVLEVLPIKLFFPFRSNPNKWYKVRKLTIHQNCHKNVCILPGP